MRLRWAATFGILLLLVLDLLLPRTGIGRRGAEARVRFDVPTAVGAPGTTLPSLRLRDLDGTPVSLADFRGHRVLLTFERSVDW